VTNLQRTIVALLEQLERISHEHEEVTDTDVRELVHLTLTWYFVWAQNRSRFPRSFGMFSAEGDRLVAGAIGGFLDEAEQSGELVSIPVGQARLNALQAATSVTSDGMHYYELIGHRDTPLSAEPLPEHMFAVGDYEA
jgi:hypothetical protein